MTKNLNPRVLFPKENAEQAVGGRGPVGGGEPWRRDGGRGTEERRVRGTHPE